MSSRDLITLAILFISLYFEVFMLITYLERRNRLKGRLVLPGHTDDLLPSVTIIVPCYNEERTAGKTIESLLALDYPSNKLDIYAINDGSTDGTLAALQAYASHPQVTVISKENGGKHTALNLGITRTTSDFVGCLDADSYTEPDALRRIMRRFQNPDIMAVVPSLHIHAPRSLIQKMQKVEYLVGIFLRSVLAELNALYVTPGPFSIFRKSVFDEVGLYKKAHNTEDMEMALRLQSRGMRIACAQDAVIYTSSPRTIRTLYKQRVRWTSGFLNNVRDYRYMLFNRRYRHIGGFVLPVMLISTASIFFILGSLVWDTSTLAHTWYVRYQALGGSMFEWSWPSMDWFYIHTTPLAFAGMIALLVILGFIVIGSRLSAGQKPRAHEILSYICLYSLIAPLWITKSVYNFALKRQFAWR